MRADIAAAMHPRGTVQTGHVAQRLISAFGIKGKVVAPTLGETLHPVVMVEDLTRNSWYNQEVERPAAGANFLTPTALQFQNFQLFNPLTSGVVVILDQVSAFVNGVADQMWMGITQTQLATASPTTSFRDTLQLATQTPAALMRSESTAAVVVVTLHYVCRNATAGVPVTYNPGVILAPGWGFNVGEQTATNSLGVSFAWRERYINP